MIAEDFCNRMGFYLEPVDQDGRVSLIDIVDTRRVLYKSGRREGNRPKANRFMNQHLAQAYDELMNLILDLLFE